MCKARSAPGSRSSPRGAGNGPAPLASSVPSATQQALRRATEHREHRCHCLLRQEGSLPPGALPGQAFSQTWSSQWHL